MIIELCGTSVAANARLGVAFLGCVVLMIVSEFSECSEPACPTNSETTFIGEPDITRQADPSRDAEPRSSVPVTAVANPEPDDTVDVLYLTEKRPIFVRWHLRRDGRSLRAVWDDFVRDAFRQLDADGDGVLRGDELVRIPAPNELLAGNLRGASYGIGHVKWFIDRDPADGRVTLGELAKYIQVSGGDMLEFTSKARNPARRLVSASRTAPSGPTDPLFARLDSNSDGLLSKTEFLSTARILKRGDEDDNDLLSFDELRKWTSGTPTRELSGDPPALHQPIHPMRVIDMSKGTDAATTARRILAWYDTSGRPDRVGADASRRDNVLSRQEFQIESELFDRLDIDRNSELAFDELRPFVDNREMSLELTVRLGRRQPGEPAVEVNRFNPQSIEKVVTTADGRIQVPINRAVWKFLAENPGDSDRVRTAYLQEFQAADRDNNKYLDRTEIEANYFDPTLFSAADADRDGRLYENEFVAHLDRRERATSYRTQMSVLEARRSLFDALDQNGDDQLSIRDLRSCLARLSEWDTNGDGMLAPDEIPMSYRVSVERKTSGSFRIAKDYSFGDLHVAVPPWFRKMDRNHDGDVSRREFLGPRDMFDRLDVDRDGLIDPVEASRKH